MNLSNVFRLVILLLLVNIGVYAQTEICNNGIDDDFDGFIDCYDNNCSSNPANNCDFIIPPSNCSTVPPQFPQFTMTLDFASPNETTNHLSRMAIGDLDRDGMPEIVSMNRYTRRLFILNGNDGSIKRAINVTWEPYWEIAIANVDNDNCAEIFFIGFQNLPGNANDGVYIFSYDCNLNLNWVTAERLRGDPINYGLADFDGDGKIELYAKDEIYDAHTGVRLVKSTTANYSRTNGGPVAADLLGDTKLELVLGLSIYQVNLGARSLDAGSLTLLRSRPEYFVRNEYNATSIADFNQDGFLDVVASGSTIANNTNTSIFFWDVQNDQILTYRDLTSDYGPNGWSNGTGRVNISDLDGDGQLNASYVSGKYLYALKEDMTLLWRVVINEETSGYTGCTLFDFNGDGKSEIVYRDERFLYIINGTDGSVYNQKSCISRTNREYPIVADVDADGSTELCVTCGFDDADAAANFNTLSYSRFAHVRVFKSAAEPWVPARRVWNQHGYFVVNVNDNLTIPRELQKHHLVFSNGNCTQGPNRPLNKFLNQSPFINSDGCPTFAAPNIAFAVGPSVVPPTCPDLDFLVSFKITNLGDLAVSGDLPVSFYTSNPLLPGAVKLSTVNLTLNSFKPNDVVDVNNILINGNGSDSVYVVLNDAGTTIPTPISLPNTSIFECDYDNVLGVKILPLPVPITAIEANPNEKCTAPENGAARAFVLLNGIENTTDFDFYWSDGVTAKPIASADFVGPIYTGLLEGDYTVYARHKTANCSSDTTQVLINALVSTIPDITITVTNQTSCNPPNGKLEAFVAGGNSGYTFEWFDNISSLGINTAVANGLRRGNYTVLVSKNGCSDTRSAFLDGTALDPTVTSSATSVTDCQSESNGSVTASVSLGGTPQPSSDYSFEWYFYDNVNNTRGSQLPAENGVGETRTGLDPGFYEVIAINNSTQCSSASSIVEVQNQIILPVVNIIELTPQTSCDPLNPNGRLQANVTIGGVPQPASDFTFEWYVGQNTLVANRHNDVSGVNGSIAEKIKGGGQFYTVKVISASQCVVTSFEKVSELIENPLITLTPTPNGICDPSLVSGTAPANRGTVTASITYQGNPDLNFSNYTFTWYNGNLATGTPRVENINTISALSTGFYTLVVTRNGTSCESLPQTAEVLNNTNTPIIDAVGNPSTNCDPSKANGSVSVIDVDGLGVNTNYDFEWFAGVTASGVLISNNATSPDTLQGAAGKFYTVLVTNKNNGCQRTRTVEVTDNKVLPIVSTNAIDNTLCIGADGVVAVNSISYQGIIVNAPFNGYTFNWSTGETTSTVNGKSAGTYTVTVTRTDVGCTSDPTNSVVNDNLYIPLINVGITNQTSCNSLAPNGALAATIDETSIGGSPSENNPARYSFSWENNGNPFLTPGTSSGSTSSISNLEGNLFYTVTVIRQSTGCTNSESIFLPEVITQPIVAAAVSSNVTRCDSPDGSILATVGGNQNGFTFFWLNEKASNQTSDVTTIINNANTTKTNDGSYSSLIPGNYTVVARDNNTNCTTQPVTRSVLDQTIQSNITITLGPTFPSSCGSTNGQMSATVAGGTGLFDLFWHRGGPVNDSINSFTNPPQFNPPNNVPFQTFLNATNSNLNNLESSIYTLVVRDKGNGCGNYKSIFLPFLNSHNVATTVTPSTICPVNIGNGSIRVVVSNIVAPNDFADYTYRLYRGENPDPAFQIGPVVGPGAGTSNPMVYSSLAPGMYTVEVRQDLAAFGSNCAVYEVVEVKSNAYSPVVDVTSISPNTACDLASGADGSATIQFNRSSEDLSAGITYSIDVSPAPRAWGGTIVRGPYIPLPLPDTQLITGLSPSSAVPFYTITVTASNNCSTQKIVSISDQPALPLVQNADVTSLPALYCDPLLEVNAAAEVRNVLVNNVPSNLNNFSFSWFTNANLTTSILVNADGDASPVKGGEVLSNVGAPLPVSRVVAGSYWVVATNKNAVGLGCDSPPIKIDIVNNSRAPEFTLRSTPNTSCDTNFEGSIQVIVNNAGSVPASLNYSYNWTSSVTPIVPPASSNGDGVGLDDNFGGLQDGTPYTLEVRNIASGCKVSGQTSIIKTSIPIIVPSASVLPQLICNPDGSIRVDSVMVGGVRALNHTDFLFNWYKNSPNSTEIVPIVAGNDLLDVTDAFTPPASMGAGNYFVKVKRVNGNPASGCESAPLAATVLDLSRQPDITITSVIPNSSCDPVNPNGVIVAIGSERSGPAGNYTFQWSFNSGVLPPFTTQQDASPSSQVVNAGQGQYLVELTNTFTGCRFSKIQDLETNESLSLPNIVDIDVVNPTNCLPQGSLRVVSLTIGGTTTLTNPPDNLDADFDYEWYAGSLPAGLIVGEQNSLLSNQLPGKYFVRVRNVNTQCISSAVEAVIDSTSIIFPILSITQLAPQVICTANVGSGVLSALADGQSDTNANYLFSWFNNLTNSGTPIANTSTVNNLVSGNYSVTVQNVATNCTSNAIFILPENKDDFLPIMSLSSNPVTRCDIDNGEVFVSAVKFTSGLNPSQNYPFNPYNYTADLYIGSPPTNISSPEFPNMSNNPLFPLLTENYVESNLPSGIYTVRLTDNNTGCATLGTITVEDEKVIPQPAIEALAPVTNCTPTDPNGVARATVNGKFVGYEFNWFEGNTATGTAVYTGVEFGELKADPVVYTIEVTDLATQCKGTVQTRIQNGTLAIPNPQITILSHLTSCLFDNGALSASVNGNTKDFIFNWYDGRTETPPADFIGEVYDSLSVGSYSVTATSRVTGCKSPLVSADILNKQEFPEFDFQVTNASCDQPNGFATVFFTSIVGIGKIEWFLDNTLVATGPNLTNAIAATYTVEAESELGCKSSIPITVLADIRPRNGISRNGDSLNDYFHIDCIDKFISNNVKIFNRAGALVYEADGYDNSNIFFDGISNKGVSPMGTSLPDGTYFFIVDKRDGSKPIAGYLEIVK